MQIRAFLVFALAGCSAQAHAATPCAATAPAAVARFFLEPDTAAISSSVASVRVCLIAASGGVGSYSATLTFDSALMRATRVDVSGGMQVANAQAAGTVRLAGAAPAGFPSGVLATLRFTLRRGTSLSTIRLAVTEVNSPSGASLLQGASVTGYPSTDPSLGVAQSNPARAPADVPSRSPDGGKLHVDSIIPRSGQVDAESVLDLALYGRGFAATGNTVLFDAARVVGLASERGGTLLRFMAPTSIPAHGDAQTHRVGPGRYEVRVRTPSGTSNAVTFTVRGEDR
jgi:hypothetical protein